MTHIQAKSIQYWLGKVYIPLKWGVMTLVKIIDDGLESESELRVLKQ